MLPHLRGVEHINRRPSARACPPDQFGALFEAWGPSGNREVRIFATIGCGKGEVSTHELPFSPVQQPVRLAFRGVHRSVKFSSQPPTRVLGPDENPAGKVGAAPALPIPHRLAEAKDRGDVRIRLNAAVFFCFCCAPKASEWGGRCNIALSPGTGVDFPMAAGQMNALSE